MIVREKELPPFATTDTALAAWLVTKGFNYTSIRHKPNPNKPLELDAEFVFTRDGNNKVDDLKDAFQSGEAYGNIVAYIRHYHVLSQKARSRGSFR